ncbi:DUF6452 family protein [uncultured Polaribacter sp.]|uniref:DUF6452 family protein n=1 Tax=uncultured Polaribacter sp. TaxID=174711 RepID=UPI002629C85E|nr:DUF6452 family protein [uncultured Polaribacter sp.]
MKKRFSIFLLFLAIFSACEKDDFCTQNPVTSKLIITFYDDTNRETLKKVQRFSIIGDGKIDSLFTAQSLDSIAIPLNSRTSETVYTLKKNATDGVEANNEIATFTIQYDTEEEYVSRSCGFKILFKNLDFSSDTNSWITDFTPSTILTIDDQNTAHVQIFH